MVMVVRAKKVVMIKVFIVNEVQRAAVASMLVAGDLRRLLVSGEDKEDWKVSLYITFSYIPIPAEASIPIQRLNLCQVIDYSGERRLSGVSFQQLNKTIRSPLQLSSPDATQQSLLMIPAGETNIIIRSAAVRAVCVGSIFVQRHQSVSLTPV